MYEEIGMLSWAPARVPLRKAEFELQLQTTTWSLKSEASKVILDSDLRTICKVEFLLEGQQPPD